MDELKYRIFSLFFFVLLLGASYWAFQHIDRRVFYHADDVVVPQEHEEVKPQVEEKGIEGNAERFLAKEEEGGGGNTQKQEKSPEKKIVPIDAEHRKLVEKLQKLIDDKIYMKKGSRGTRVGTVQEFLNLYFDDQMKIDNDYGPKTMERVRVFQQKEGLDADGLAGPQTYEKMIELIEEGEV